RLAGVTPPARIARHLAANRLGNPGEQLPGAIEQQAAPWARVAFPGQCLQQASLDLGADAGDRGEPPRRRRLPELIGGADAQGLRDLDRAPRGQPQKAAEPDQLGSELTLELRE